MKYILLLSIGLFSVTTVSAGFKCSFAGAKDRRGCVTTTDTGDDDHCVWCELGASGFDLCVSEIQAEALEEKIPTISCDRYTGSDDDGKPPDNTDDKTTPTDDSVPDDFWTCLQKKGAAECEKSNCTWCDTKGGFGVCMTGPAAESATNSSWFSCHKSNDENIAGVVTNPKIEGRKNVRIVNSKETYDTSCMLAYLQDPSKDGCVASMDSDGKNCEFCSLQGSISLCLTNEQAEYGEQIGIKCDDQKGIGSSKGDVFDTSCMKAFFLGQNCEESQDADGEQCQICYTPDGRSEMCLTSTQGDMASQLGVWCDNERHKTDFPEEFWTCLLNNEDASCLEGACSWCKTSFGTGFCLSNSVADIAKPFDFIDCAVTGQQKKIADSAGPDPFDIKCAAAGMGSDDAEQVCISTIDGEGKQCVWCDAAGVFGLCLSADQAAAARQVLKCDSRSITIE
jgi:predicted 3-demethylubiquinone-9 3-methyltransferase (glyoxalase superfamily)